MASYFTKADNDHNGAINTLIESSYSGCGTVNVIFSDDEIQCPQCGDFYHDLYGIDRRDLSHGDRRAAGSELRVSVRHVYTVMGQDCCGHR